LLVDDPMLKDFAGLGDASYLIGGVADVKFREFRFAIYQVIAQDKARLA
jgi:hypothetical protein